MSNEATYRAAIEAHLDAALPGGDAMRDAMRYAMLSGGKRIRPILTLEFCRICGGDVDAALPVACGVEMLHGYSLVHDDLPCMDNDDTRRGRPACHVAFGETVATLAGDCLQAEAFASVCRAPVGAAAVARCCALLAKAAGADGICGGQLLDLTGANDSEQALLRTDMGKTAALIAAACAMGAAAADAPQALVQAAWDYGTALGMAFQCRDDLLDGDGLCALLGPEECTRRTREYTQTALRQLESFENTEFLRKLTGELAERFT